MKISKVAFKKAFDESCEDARYVVPNGSDKWVGSHTCDELYKLVTQAILDFEISGEGAEDMFSDINQANDVLIILGLS